MKTRLSFVSNSSSASYIVKIDMPEEDFIQTIYDELDYTFFNLDSLINDY